MRAALFAAVASVGCACPGGDVARVEGASDLELCVEVARTEEARRAGLRGRAPLGPGVGLLLAFSVEDEICVVNDGVSFAIDALYADTRGRVIAIERDVGAGDATPRCHAPSRWVLEVSAGGLEGVVEGDVLVVPAHLSR